MKKQMQVQVFENTEFGKIRTIEIDGEPWFVGKEVASVLGYAKPLNALDKHVDGDDSLFRGLIDGVGRNQKTKLINESGLYSLILSSKLPNAKAFKRWVTSEVLPSIRKTGAYVTDELLDKLANSEEERDVLFDTLIKERKERREEQSVFNRNFENNEKIFAAIRSECDDLLEENTDLKEDNKLLESCIGALLPSADYCDTILQCEDAIPVSVIASTYGLSAVVFNRMLHEIGIQRKVGGTWILYARYNGNGYTVLRSYPVGENKAARHSYWTERGRKFLYDTLKTCGIIPTVERREIC